MLPEIQADFDRIKNLIEASKNLPDDASGEAVSMVNEYLCVAITGRLEQNLKQVFIKYAERASNKAMGAAINRLCQSFQNPSREKICDLVSLFDKSFASILEQEWKEDGSIGHVISDMVGKRKVIAHQTKNSRDTTSTKIDQFFGAYKEAVVRIHDHFLK